MKKANTTAQIRAFQLGYRFSLISGINKEILGDLIQEIVKHTNSPEILSAFNVGEHHGYKEKGIIQKNLQNETELREQAKQKDEEKRINQEVIELQKIRENRQEKPQTKTR